jgi:uncharacterized protein (DUF924 family)
VNQQSHAKVLQSGMALAQQSQMKVLHSGIALAQEWLAVLLLLDQMAQEVGRHVADC